MEVEDVDEVNVPASKEGWVLRVLLRFAPSLPSQPSDVSEDLWLVVATGSMFWGCVPLYAGAAAFAALAARSLCWLRTAHTQKPARRQLALIISALALVIVGGWMDLEQGLAHIEVVQDHVDAMLERLRVVDDASAQWLDLTTSALALVRIDLPDCPEAVQSRLARIAGYLQGAESLLAPSHDLAGTQRLLEGARAWWKRLPRKAFLGLLPLALVLVSCVAVVCIVGGRRRDALQVAFGRKVVLVVVGTAILVTTATSAALASLGVSAAALCGSQARPLLLCLQPSLDESTVEACCSYMQPSPSTRLMLRPSQASWKWETVHSLVDVQVGHEVSSARLLQLREMALDARRFWHTIQERLQPTEVHATYSAAVSHVCGVLLVDIMLIATCWLLVGLVCLPALALLAIGHLEGTARAPEAFAGTELVPRSPLPVAPASWAHPLRA